MSPKRFTRKKADTCGISLPPRPKVPADTKAAIEKSIEKELRRLLGYPDTGPLPDATVKAIKSAAASATDRVAASQLSRLAQRIVSEKIDGAVDIQSSLQEKMKVGLTGIKSMTDSPDYTSMLQENAKMMKAKYDALKTAGFTDDQAFRLIEAEVYAKGASRPRR